MSKYEDKPTASRGYDSALEEQIVEGLSRQLKAPWKIQRDPGDMQFSTANADLRYTPDVVLRNEDTGKLVVLEFKQNMSLSMPNLMKFQRIQSAYESSGAEFLLVVHGDQETPKSDSRFTEYGINAIDVTRVEDAAGEIERHLPET